MEDQDILKKNSFLIAHFSDIHIKDVRREEYKEVFEKAFEKLKEKKVEIIAICGDIFHDKTKVSANNYFDAEYFFIELSKIAPVVMILGNHDLNLKVPNSPDLVSPVLSNHTILKPPRFIFWRNSGVYYAHGLVWVVISPDGLQPTNKEIEEFLKKNKLEKFPIICLAHETIRGSLIDNGITINSGRLNSKDLEEYDAVLLGDIHLRQRIGKNKRIMYPGSLVQQDIGENHLNHGFIIWKIIKSDINPPYRTNIPEIEEVNIANNKGFLKVKIKSGKNVTSMPIPNSPNYYEVEYDSNTDEAKLNEIIAELEKKIGFYPRSINKKIEKNSEIEEKSRSFDQARIDSNSQEFHEKLIEDILGKNSSYLEEIKNVHRENFRRIKKNRSRSLIRLVSMEFSNLYCYGEKNFIDFTKLEKKLCGTVAPNKSGKSSLLDIIIFALYDEYPRADQKISIIRNNKDNYYLLLNFEVDGKKCSIEKTGKKRKKLLVSDYRFFFDGEELTKGTNTLTCQEIEKLVGCYKHSRITSIFHQENNFDFFKMNSSEKKKNLSDLLSIGFFEELEGEIVEELKEIRTEINVLERDFSEGKLDIFLNEKVTIAKQRSILQCSFINLNEKIKKNQQEIDRIEEKKIKILNFLAIKKNKFEEINSRIAQEDFSERKITIEKFLEEFEVKKREAVEEEYRNYSVLDYNDKFEEVTSLEKELIKEKELRDLIERNKKKRESEKIKKKELEKKLMEIKLDISKSNHSINFFSSLIKKFNLVEIDLTSFLVKKPRVYYSLKYEPHPFIEKRKDKRYDLELVNEARKVIENELSNKTWQSKPFILEKISSLSRLLEKSNYEQKRKEYYSLKKDLEKEKGLLSEEKNNEEELTKSHKELEAILENLKEIDRDFLDQIEKEQINKSKKNIFDLEEIRSSIRNTNIQLLIAENSKEICKKLFFSKECESCNFNKSFLAPKENYFVLKKNLKEMMIDFFSLLVFRRDEIKEKINHLEEKNRIIELIKKKMKSFLEIEKEIDEYNDLLKEKDYWTKIKDYLDILESYSYWWENDKKALLEYEEARKLLNEIKKLQITKSKQEKLLFLLEKESEKNEKKNQKMDEEEKTKITWRRRWLRKIISYLNDLEILKEEEKIRCEAKKNVLKLKKKEVEFDSLNKRLDNKIKEKKLFLDERDELIKRDSSLESRNYHLDDLIEREKKGLDELMVLKRKYEFNYLYKKILNPKSGIAYHILKESRLFLEREVNAYLKLCGTSFSIYIDEEFNLMIVEENFFSLPSTLASGYQKFSLSLAFREALWKLADVPLLDCKFIDEGFGCCDENNLELISNHLLSSLKIDDLGSPRFVFVVSHLEKLKNAIMNPLLIEITKDGSKIDNR